MTEIKNLNEFKKSVSDAEFIYCDLFDSNGKKILQRNRLKKDFLPNLERIIKKINSTSSPNGTYLIRCYVFTTDQEPQTFAYHKGGIKSPSLSDGNNPIQTIKIIEKEKREEKPDVLSYDKALEYQNRIAQLEYELKLKESKIKELEEEIEALEEESELTIADPSMQSKDAITQIKETIETIFATGMPILDRSFQLRERKLALEEYKTFGQAKKYEPKIEPQKQPEKTQQEIEAENKVIEGVDSFIESIKEDEPQTAQWLEALSNQSSDLYDYLGKIKANKPELFTRLDEYVTEYSEGSAA